MFGVWCEAESHDLEFCSRRLPSYHVPSNPGTQSKVLGLTSRTSARDFTARESRRCSHRCEAIKGCCLTAQPIAVHKEKQMNRFIARVTLITLIGVTVVLAVWLADSRANSQQPDRIVVRKPWPTEPVKVVAVKTKNKTNVEIGKAFEEDDDWFDGFTVKVANNYHKTVTVMTISMVFRREPGDIRPPFAWNLHFGPSAMTLEYKDRDPNKVVKAGETVELGVSPEDYKLIKAAFKESGYPTKIKRVELV